MFLLLCVSSAVIKMTISIYVVRFHLVKGQERNHFSSFMDSKATEKSSRLRPYFIYKYKDAQEEMYSGKGNILPDLVFYYHHHHEKSGVRISEKQNCRKKEETTHIVERRRNTGKITEASLTRREALSTIIKLGREYSL